MLIRLTRHAQKCACLFLYVKEKNLILNDIIKELLNLLKGGGYMATHNSATMVGYLLKDPIVLNSNEEGNRKVIVRMRTVRRDAEGYYGRRTEDVAVYYDGDELFGQITKLKRFDLIYIKGVFNILTMDKKSSCPWCSGKNVKYRGSATFIYPIFIMKLQSLSSMYDIDAGNPEKFITDRFTEISNMITIMGTVVSDPEMVGPPDKSYCRYRLGVDRKYYIKTQDDITADYPWVYSCGQQAEWDYRHLLQGSVIQVDGFMRSRKVKANMTCEHCGQVYTYDDIVTEFIPYSLEYLSGYKTDEDIANEEEEARLAALNSGNS